MPNLGINRPDYDVASDAASGKTKVDYPNLYLSTEQIEALGLTVDDLGKTLAFSGVVKVDSFSIDERDGRDKSTSASLAFHEGYIERKSSNEERAERLFGPRK